MDMYELVVAFKEDDEELKQAIKEIFHTEFITEKEYGFDAWESFLTVVIPISEWSVTVLQFVMNYFCNHNKANKRLIIEADGKIDLTGYSADEAERILKLYFEHQTKKNE